VDTYAIAVFDVGKTNKKLLVYDRELRLLDCSYGSFPAFTREGVDYEDMEGIEGWFLEQLALAASRHPIRAISVTTHGATFACLDGEGRLSIPVISYTTEPGEEFREEYYRLAGDRVSLQVETATAGFAGLLNVAQGIYFVRQRFPAGFARTAWILNYPQFFGHYLTGRTGAEPTYVGCHTYLWDFRAMEWSQVASKLGIRDKLPARLQKPWEVLGPIRPQIARRTGLAADTLVTLGIHDSNASLLPYLIKTKEQFVLNSSGTWCVCMHPARQVSFSPEELGKVVFYNLSAFGRPVKTAIFMGGMEFDTYLGLFKGLGGERPFPVLDLSVYRKLAAERQRFILPSVVRGTGQFPASDPVSWDSGRRYPLAEIDKGQRVPPFFRDFPTAYAVLNLSLAIQSKVAVQRAGLEEGMSLFLEGGFRKNEHYASLLAALFPRCPMYLTNLEEATAFGAALLAKAAVEGRQPRELDGTFELDKVPVDPLALPELEGYTESFLKLL